jgi:myxalamid-type polyketide synthase MxaD
VVGHSMGEVAAACVSGGLSLEDAARVICVRSKLLRRVSGRGGMALVERTIAEAKQDLRGYEEAVSIAVSNSARSTVLSGDMAVLTELVERLQGQGVFCRFVKVDVASHSPQVDPLCAELLEALSGLSPQRVSVPFRSTVTGEALTGLELDARYWVRNLREPVLFGAAVEELAKAGHDTFVELSAHPLLLPAIEEALRPHATKGRTLASMRREEDERSVLLEAAGALYAQGHEVSWERLQPEGGKCISLPTYPFQRERYWVESALMPWQRSGKRRGTESGHPLVGDKVESSVEPGHWLFERELSAEEVPYLQDHKVQGAVVLPAAAYLEMALSCASEAFGEQEGIELEEMRFLKALVLTEGERRLVQQVLRVAAPEEGPTKEPRASFRVSSRPLGDAEAGTDWTLHAEGTVLLGTAGEAGARAVIDLAATQARCPERLDAETYYASLEARGLEYGPVF